MKKAMKKMIALLLCAVMVLGTAGIAASASDKGKTYEAEPVNTAENIGATAEAEKNDETVYVIQDYEGNKQVIVSDSKDDEPHYLEDAPELPVEVTVSCQLDESEIAAEDLAGKSGWVKIRFDYVDNQRKKVTVNGKTEEMYVPFAAITGLILDNDHFSNIEVVNGKMLDDGERTVIVGLAFPGLQENLRLDEDKSEIPSYMEITAYATDFEMESAYTIITNSVFKDLNTDKFGSFDDMADSAGKLTDAMTQLMGGSDDIYNGLVSLLSGANELADGIGQLSEGLDTLTENNTALNEGARQVFESLLSMANAQLSEAGLDVPALTIDNYETVLNGILASMNADKVAEQVQVQVEQAVRARGEEVRSPVTEAVRQEVASKVTQAVRQNVLTQVLAGIGMNVEEYDKALSAGMIPEEQVSRINAAVAQQMESDKVKAAISAKTDEQMKSPEVLALIDSKTEEQIKNLISQQMASKEVQAKMQEALKQASEGAAKIGSLKAQLDSYNTFYRGLISYTNGVANAASGARKLNESMPQLISGITALRDGALQLSDGLKQLNEEGIQKLAGIMDGDLSEISERLRKTKELAEQYRSYTGNSDSVKFIYKTKAIKGNEN